jgi:imidazolonepropionase-like amidohydrolase
MRLGVFALLSAAATLHAQKPIAFTNVTVVDVAAGVLRANQTVVIHRARITAAGDASRVRVPTGARVVPGEGAFLIPGMWDMHVHDFPHPHVPELYLANGVTGVRNMYDVAALREVRTAIEQHRRPGPRVIASGRTLNGEREKNEQVVVRTPAQAREAVRGQIRDGADFIKVYNALPREAYFAIADEAKRARIPFAGHTPDAITTVDAAAAGQLSIEHLDGILLDSSPLGAWLRQSRRFVPDRRLLDTFDPARAATVFAAYVRHGVWHCPTLTIYQPANVANLDRVPKAWRPRSDKTLLKDTPLDLAIHKKTMEVTAMMFRAGVRLLAGTDTGVPYILPGFGLHDELELMAAAGIPASAVLRIATLAPARFLDREKDLGTIAAGKLADLVLLDADPLQSIANTRRVRAVVADGQFYDRAALDRMLAAVN